MPVRRACWLLGMMAMAAWLVQPAEAQVESEAIPEELRIIEDFPEVGAERAAEEGPEILDEGRETLFDRDQSLIFAPPEDSPAERLLPGDDDVPDVALDPESRDRARDDVLPGPETGSAPNGDELQERITGPENTVPQPRDRSGVGAGPAGGGTGGGSGSLF